MACVDIVSRLPQSFQALSAWANTQCGTFARYTFRILASPVVKGFVIILASMYQKAAASKKKQI